MLPIPKQIRLYKGKRVAVIGGGNGDGFQAYGSKIRCRKAMIVYRRSKKRCLLDEEVHHAKSEGIDFLTLHNPIEYIGKCTVTYMILQVMKLVS